MNADRPRIEGSCDPPRPLLPALRVAWIHDADAVRGATGVTRHALAQLDGLARRPDVSLVAVSGRIRTSEGLMFWRTLDDIPSRELPVSTRIALRLWRVLEAPPIEWWTGPVDWVYAPAEYDVAVGKAKRAITCHDVLQDLRLGTPRRRAYLERCVARADLVCSVSEFNTRRLVEAFPGCRDRVVQVPNAADDLFFGPAAESERARVRSELGLPAGMPYLLTVANFQPRKNLPRWLRAAGRLESVRAGELALVLVGEGDEANARLVADAVAALGPGAVVKRPGYVQGKRLRAIYAEALMLVFPSTCESFGIPAVEAMAQGTPVALADSTALPEIAGEAAWYFDPEDEESVAETVRTALGDDAERSRRAVIGRDRASGYRWGTSTSRLVEALSARR